MVAPAFPLIKLGALAIRQIAKPIANQLKTRAKTSLFFRDYVCMPPAQAYHYFEVNVKMKMLGKLLPLFNFFSLIKRKNTCTKKS